ncbi:hypothetical protein LTR17_004419 [Elasticomyces elasticus]|nr:hypothetical protein LTR17_004419 [Elasticomyces elasticus]
MATRKSARFTSSKLPERMDEIEAQVKSKLARDNRAVREANSESASTVLNFEVSRAILTRRNRSNLLYLYVLDTKTPHKLHTLKAPTIALASKQIRAEVLPLFFTKCHFIVEVHSNYPDIKRLNAVDPYGGDNSVKPRPGELKSDEKLDRWSERGVYLHSGRVRGSPWLPKLEGREGVVPVFRHFELKIFDGSQTGYGRRFLEVNWMGIEVLPSVARGLRSVVTYDTREGNTIYPRELGIVRGRAKAKLEEIPVEREVFPGFTLMDVDAVAKEFAYWPEWTSA